MAGPWSRRVSAEAARAHTRKAKQCSSSKLPFVWAYRAIQQTILAVLLVGVSVWAYWAVQPPPPKICGSPDGPAVTATRIKLRDGRHLAYVEHGVPKHIAMHKIIHLHGGDACRHNAVVADTLSPDIIKGLGVYIVSFDRPGYGESDPHPARTMKSMALDIEDLADQLGLGPKFYVIGSSMGGNFIWGCLKYIPHRLAGAALLAPVVNFWLPSLPSNLSTEAFYQQLPQVQWALRVAHYAPWLTYWWNTQKWFPSYRDVRERMINFFCHQDIELLPKLLKSKDQMLQVRQQGDYESFHRDLIVGFGSYEFDPVDLENPFPNGEGSVHLWQGDEDNVVPVTLQRYIAQQLPYVRYHELPGAGHLFAYADGMCDVIVKTLINGDK